VEALNLNLSMQKPFDSHFHGLLERAVLLLWQESNKDSIRKPKATRTPEARMPAGSMFFPKHFLSGSNRPADPLRGQRPGWKCVIALLRTENLIQWVTPFKGEVVS
jgi:hypothetical protein